VTQSTRPGSAGEAYRAIIDQLVDETRLSGSAPNVSQSGVFSNAPAHAEFNGFIESLDDSGREIVARMMESERLAAIHDVLAVLSWWIDCAQVGLTFRGEPIPVDQSGAGLHGDFIGRTDGWEWPPAGDD
jgi:hypothetical protein